MIDSKVLRILDANANRAREALRVMEDYARFVLDSQEVSQHLKSFRHELAEALGPILSEAIVHRNVAEDVGKSNTTATEMHRESSEDVVLAAGKRLGEALRSLEEFTKTINPAIAGRLEALRYRSYEIEQGLARTFSRGGRFASVRLYVLITQSLARIDWFKAAEQAIAGGADCLQLREKDLDTSELLHRAYRLVDLCRRSKVLCIINDRADVALAADADGVHLGQTDFPPAAAREILGNDKLIGVSTHNPAQAKQAVLDGADYIGVGPVYRSTTKTRDFLPGLEYAAEATSLVKIPTVAIAGIGPENVDDVLKTGVSAVAVTASVLGADDIAGAARELKRRILLARPA